VGYYTAYINPFNHMSSVHLKLLPGDLGGGGVYLNTSPGVLAFKADKKQSKTENKEFDLLMSMMTEDGRQAKYCNVYTFHGSAWSAFKSFLDRKGFLYMYDHGTVTNEYMMSVAVNWAAEKLVRQSPKFIRILMAHFIGECVAARCCDTPCDKFGLGLYRTGERALALNGGRLGDDFEESWVSGILGILPKAKDSDIVKWMGLVLSEAAMVAYDMSVHPDDSRPMMDVKPQSYSQDTVKCWGRLMNGIPASIIGPNMQILRKALSKLITEAPKEMLRIKAEERKKAMERMQENAIGVSTMGKKMSAADILKLHILNNR
jgi:hypothetical protein